MDASSVECLKDLLNSLPEWQREFDLLSRMIEDWKLKYEHGQNNCQLKPVRGDPSSTDPSRSVFLSPEIGKKTPNRRTAAMVASSSRKIPSMNASGKMNVIHYDSAIQTQMETLVKAINNGQVCVRRGKLAARASVLSYHTGPAVDSARSRYLQRSAHGDALTASQGPCKKANHMRVECFDPDRKTRTAFDDLELALLDCQTLCEHAAYQVLRDGDCEDELEVMRKCFQDVSQICIRELEKQPEHMDLVTERNIANDTKGEADASNSIRAGSLIPDMRFHTLDVDEEDESGDFPTFVMPHRGFLKFQMMAH